MKRLTLGALVCATMLLGCETGMTTDGGTGGGGGGTTTTGGGGGGTGGGSTGGGGGSMGTDAGVDAGTPGTIVAVASGNADLSILVAAVQKAGLVDALNDSSANLTVFAPTNAAFTQLLTDLGITNGLDGLTAEQLAPILKYHVLGQRVDGAAATTAAQGNQKVTALGGSIALSLSGTAIQLDGRAKVVAADVPASNGVVHVIDAVILPSIADIATTTPALSNLVAALTLADSAQPSPGLVTTLDTDSAALTVFAPTDTAFAGLVTALKGSNDGGTTGIAALTDFRPDQVLPVLRYHVAGAKVLSSALPAAGTATTLGGTVAVSKSAAGVTIDAAKVTTADLLASNGVVHLIDGVLVPSITDVVTTDARFTSLKDAVVAADGAANTTPKVAAALDGAGPFTLFAPTNAAFTALPQAPSGQALTDVLLYHAVPGPAVYAAAALSLTTPLVATTALSGASVTVSSTGSAVRVADSTSTAATVQVTNLFTSNGVIHAVDKVLIPAE